MELLTRRIRNSLVRRTALGYHNGCICVSAQGMAHLADEHGLAPQERLDTLTGVPVVVVPDVLPEEYWIVTGEPRVRYVSDDHGWPPDLWLEGLDPYAH